MKCTITYVLTIFALLLFAVPASADDAQTARYESFAKRLTGSTFTGNFTVLGQDNASPPKESYKIVSVKKLKEGDYWLFKARIRYGGNDVTMPLPLEVKWAGDTPIITLTNLDLPGLGVFSSRVIVYNGKYAGTWTHGKVGGHLFGVVKKNGASDKE